MMYGLIIAAGKQSRFKSDVPKALMKFNDKTIVEHNIDILNKYCDNVFIVCSLENNSYFNQFENKIIIESGKGSGDAIFRAIKTLNFSSDDSCIITWGDAILNEKLVDYSINRFKGYYCTIPCTFEKHPYVELGHTIYNKKFVKFSKYGDNIGAGYHDQCLFICNLDELNKYLTKFYEKFYNEKEQKYYHKHGNEFEFLDVFNDTMYKFIIVEVNSSLRTKTFNTLEELEDIRKNENKGN